MENVRLRNFRQFIWQQFINFDTEYFLLLLILSHFMFSIYHVAIFFALILLYWCRNKDKGILNVLQFIVRFLLHYKIFFLNFAMNLFTPKELYYFTFMQQFSKSVFNYIYSTGEHTWNNFSYDWALNEIICINFLLFVAICRHNLNLVVLYIYCTFSHYVIILMIQCYLYRRHDCVTVYKTARGTGDTSHLVLVVPVEKGEGTIKRYRFHLIIPDQQPPKLARVEEHIESKTKFWENYFIPFLYTGTIGK